MKYPLENIYLVFYEEDGDQKSRYFDDFEEASNFLERNGYSPFTIFKIEAVREKEG